MSSFTYQNEYNTGTGLFASGAANSGGVPIGTIIMWATATPPSDYLKCDGTLYATAGSYAQLFAVIGTTYGTGAGQFAVPNFTGKFPAGTGGVASLVSNRQIESGVIGSDGSTATNTNTGVSVLDVVATPDHHHAVGTLANDNTTAVNDNATLDTSNLEAHNHYYGHLHLNPHTHDLSTGVVTGGSHDHAVGTIAYTQNNHDHEMLLHDHDISPHQHPLDYTGGSGNWAFPFKYNNFGSATYSGFWYGKGADAASSGATHCYYPQSVVPQNNAGTTTTGNSNTTNTAVKIATGSMAGTTETDGVVSGTISGDTGDQEGTSYAEPTATSRSKQIQVPHSTDNYTDDTYDDMSIPDHTHVQQQHLHTITGDTGAYETTAGAAITQEKYAPPFLAITFCIRYRQT